MVQLKCEFSRYIADSIWEIVSGVQIQNTDAVSKEAKGLNDVPPNKRAQPFCLSAEILLSLNVTPQDSDRGLR